MRNELTYNLKLGAAIVFTVSAIFMANHFVTANAALNVLFVVPVLLTIFHPNKNVTIYVAAGCTILTLISFFLNDQQATSGLNIIISIIGIWLAFYFIIKFKKITEGESKNKESLNALFEYATEGIIIATAKGEIKLINPIAEIQFGYEKGELVGKKIEVLIPERLSERHVKHREKYARNPYPRPMGKGNLLFGKRKDGSEFPVEISLSHFSNNDGKFVIAFIIDISERLKVDELLQKEKEIAQMYLDIAPVIFLVLSRNQQVTLINQNGCRILGFHENEIIGKNWFDNFVSSAHREQVRDIFEQLMNGTKSATEQYENEIQTSSGERLIAWKNTIIRDEKGVPIATLSSGEDITEARNQQLELSKATIDLKQYSNEILQLNADLEKRVHERTEELGEVVHRLEDINDKLAKEVKERRQAEELLETKREELRLALEKEKVLSELKSRFVTMASHEFRTPLSTILSSASLISKYNEPGNDDKRLKHIERIKSSVSNLTTILNDFLSIGKLEEGKVQCTPSEFDIVNFSNDLVGELKELTNRGQTISYQHNGSGTRVFLDKNLTRNICINLLSNAIKYSGEGKQVEFKTIIENNRLLISVTDQGIGIPEAEQNHIFERFFRANNAGNIQGTGLGLNIVKKYVELMEGEVTFNSEFEKGTTFTVTLPVSISHGGQNY